MDNKTSKAKRPRKTEEFRTYMEPRSAERFRMAAFIAEIPTTEALRVAVREWMDRQQASNGA